MVAGNRALIKTEYLAFSSSSGSSLRVSLRPEITVVTGGPDVAMILDAAVDHLLFTGSTSVGRKVMAAAAQNLTPVTLELGGKSPAVIAPDYPVEQAAQRVLAGKLLNAGQTCIAPDYVLVARSSLASFVDASALQAKRMYPSGIDDPDYCSIINPRQYGRLVGYLDEIRGAGGKVVPLFDGRPQDDEAHRLGPAILVDPNRDSAVMRDEIFGPLLPVLPYDDIKQAVAFVNALPRPLALYWFDEDRGRTDWALKQTHVGGACVNETLMHVAQEELPFGGVGPSGMGHYHGRWGFETFSKLTPVFRQSKINGMNLFMPPYQPRVQRLLGLMKRF
jgi:coniferyl-aldehyde dehydrogenase